ncbi:uncharacterized protein LOC111268265 [Varroa jacobsoni]|uniref:Uncharacterized protein n=1 Tax=Varroa destructor TaxID=109461 RepID=A0A7M7M4I0_VARDE|nr:uncharacterized protein LOC111244968 [Varroa destructor]XP_022702878.1 uncharacterized protein LOC111268265 [Varroa jacobsoni]
MFSSMRNHLIIVVVGLLLPLVVMYLTDGKASAESPKRTSKYINFFKSSSQLLGSGSTTSARYIQSPTPHFHALSHGHVYPRHGSARHYHYQGDSRVQHAGMMTSASEHVPSRIIIVRQPNNGSSKKRYPSSQPYSSVQYLPQASSAGPTVAYTAYGSYPPYSYAPQTLPTYSYQMPPLRMSASAYAPQLTAPLAYSPATQLSHSHSPLVASMIAAAHRVIQGPTSHAYGGQYATATTYMPPQYSGPYGGYGTMPTPMYPGYGYLG